MLAGIMNFSSALVMFLHIVLFKLSFVDFSQHLGLVFFAVFTLAYQ